MPERYGWSINEKTVNQRMIEDTPGNFRKITVKYFENGFKRWGNIDTQKIKMLIIGDSYTEMNWVSNGEEWYSYLEKNFENLELFVYGGGGYGTLQEFMILDDFIDKIQPQIVLFQFCGNDHENNLYALDLKSYPRNNLGVRPYLENGKIVYRLPLPLSKLRKHSFVADQVLARYDKFVWDHAMKNLAEYWKKRNSGKLNMPESEKKILLRLQGEALAVTNRIYAMIRKRVSKTIPLYIFNFDDDPRVEEICSANKIICIPGITKELVSKEKEGSPVYIANDGHWNKLGNGLVGKKLVEYFEKTGFNVSPKN